MWERTGRGHFSRPNLRDIFNIILAFALNSFRWNEHSYTNCCLMILNCLLTHWFLSTFRSVSPILHLFCCIRITAKCKWEPPSVGPFFEGRFLLQYFAYCVWTVQYEFILSVGNISKSVTWCLFWIGDRNLCTFLHLIKKRYFVFSFNSLKALWISKIMLTLRFYK